MIAQSSVRFKMLCCNCLLLALLGCSRSAVVIDPEGASQADESSARRVARGQADDAEGTSFTFPDDAGGVLLAKALTPKEPDKTRPERTETPRRSAKPMKVPSLPLPPSNAFLPALPSSVKATPLRPRLVIDETLGGLPEALILPSSPTLPAGSRVRMPSVDVNEPIVLPILAQPVPDRASLDDPTLEASSAAAVAATIPPRTNKAPFLKATLPDPYDRRRADIASPEETKEFPLGTPQTPRR
jgi:hypothetical protein